jgi:repressor LexA
MPKKSDRGKLILRFIYNTLKNKNYPPTVREIGEAVGLNSTSTVHGHLERLESKGLIYRDSNRPRVLKVTDLGIRFLGEEVNKIPLLGKVAAGEPILAIEEATSFFPLPDYLENEANSLFILKITGESMINVGIFNNDLVIVKKQDQANNGEIVIAQTQDHEITCKRFFKENNHFRLQPENDYLEPMIFNQVKIIGKVIALYRVIN